MAADRLAGTVATLGGQLADLRAEVSSYDADGNQISRMFLPRLSTQVPTLAGSEFEVWVPVILEVNGEASTDPSDRNGVTP